MAREFKVLAWNIERGGGARLPRICEALVRLDADLIILSEWTPTSSVSVAEHLGARGWEHSVARFSPVDGEGRKLNHGLLAVSRMPITEVRVAAPSDAPSSWLELVVDDLDLAVVGVRVLSPTSSSSFDPKVYWEWLASQAERIEDSDAMLIGDFNVPAHSVGTRFDPGVAQLLSRGWRDAVADANEKPPHSFFSKTGSTPLRNDYCFVSAALSQRVVSATHPAAAGDILLAGTDTGKRLSDHAPVTITVEPLTPAARTSGHPRPAS